MSSTGFLLRPIFWYIFPVVVVVGLFFYGMRLVREDTLLARYRRDLATANIELAEMKQRNDSLHGDLVIRTDQLSAKDRQLGEITQQLAAKNNDLVERTQQLNERERELGERIRQLGDRDRLMAQSVQQLAQKDRELAERTQQLSRKDSTIAALNSTIRSLKDAPHPYGKDHARVTLYSNCQCSNLRVWLDGDYIGEATAAFSIGSPACGAPGTASAVVLSGRHHVVATDGAGRRWDFYMTVREDSCQTQGLSLR
jgi:hypothetical protein